MKIGVDIGGTSVKIGFFEGNKLIHKYSIPTKKDELFQDVCQSIKLEMKKKLINNLDGIGVGVPGNIVKGKISFLPNIGLKDIDLVESIKSYFPNIPIRGINDATAAALGESSITKLDNAIFITLGTGVGGGFIQDGKVIEGYSGAAGEIGHMYIDHLHLYPCTCGLYGCLETVASATGFNRLANEYCKDYSNSVLCSTKMTAKDIIDAAKQKDPLGMKVFYEVCDYLGHALANLALTTNPDCFIIGGGVSQAGQFLLEEIKRCFSKYAHYAVKDTEILLAKLGNDAGILGAALLI